YLPQDQVSTLASLISDEHSEFYTAQSGIAFELAACVDPALAITSISGPKGSNSSSDSNSSRVRRDAIIGVCSSLGGIALIVLAYIAYRAVKRRRELAHRRLSDPGDLAGARPDGQAFDQDSIGGQRRRSFYYAEDNIRGQQGVRADEEQYDQYSQAMRERRNITPGAISAPILQQSSMNW
ncbi:hypothetical protein CONPUDRAFT_56067, partial [Coniophora puteana RWD-64-598 SS2]